LNHYDTFRKYTCEDCGGVFICECERQLALAFLPHQVRFATEYGTHKRYPVTGFAQNICADCRQEKEEAHPRAAIYGLKGKIERYYWREIFKTYCGYILDWLQQNSEQVNDILEFKARFPEKAKELKKKAKKYWQSIDKQSPKYNLKEKTEAEFLSRVQVPLIKIEAKYQQIDKKGQKIGKWLNQSGELVSVEEIATEWYRAKGYNVLRCERKLISALVATFLSHPIQDSSDLRVRPTFRGSTKGWTSQNRDTPLISILLPKDFGTAEFYKRREVAIQARIELMKASNNLHALFDELLDDSESLRDYLWVNDNKAVELARITLDIIPKEMITACIEWAIRDFWHRQTGWADLLAYKDNSFIFIEVKSPYDELSQEQMNWFQWAMKEARIPCEICRIKRSKK
jgi:Holliday junction resolvase-like predicted endonuclease